MFLLTTLHLLLLKKNLIQLCSNIQATVSNLTTVTPKKGIMFFN